MGEFAVFEIRRSKSSTQRVIMPWRLPRPFCFLLVNSLSSSLTLFPIEWSLHYRTFVLPKQYAACILLRKNLYKFNFSLFSLHIIPCITYFFPCFRPASQRLPWNGHGKTGLFGLRLILIALYTSIRIFQYPLA